MFSKFGQFDLLSYDVVRLVILNITGLREMELLEQRIRKAFKENKVIFIKGRGEVLTHLRKPGV